MRDATGKPIVNDHLWSLRFGNGAAAGDRNTLFFTAGIDNEMHGLFGSIQAIPVLEKHSIIANLPLAAMQTFSTVPPNGDVNPYGVAFVPANYQGGGALKPGDILVSNFNNSGNTQGTGTTIVRISPTGEHSVFFPGNSPLGLTTALGVLRRSFVIVGNVPTDALGNAQQGSLLILDSNGKLVTTLADATLLDGPWDLAIHDAGATAQVFVANVLSGTITRIDLKIPKSGSPVVESEVQIASGYAHRTDPAALVVGPTGLTFDAKRDILYVASTADNAIFSVPHALERTTDAGMGKLVYQDPIHLHGPLGLVLAPNGNLIASNGDAVNPDPNQNSEIVEFTPKGQFVTQFQLDPNVGAAFGIALSSDNNEIRFAAVNDDTNTLEVWTFQL
jgi:hypothetical protein